MELIREVGALAGLAAFIGLAVLALLYFAQARDVRRLRESASFLVDGEESPGATVPGASRAASGASSAPAGDPATAPPAGTEQTAKAGASDSDAEAFRRAELARQAEERRRRFEERRHGGRGGGLGGLPGGWIAVAGALILMAGVAFGATRVIGGDENGQAANRTSSQQSGQVTVAVFNGTAEPGLAADFAQTMQQVTGYQPDPITNTESPYETSTVMFERGARVAADEVAKALGIRDVTGMDPEIRRIADQAQVAVILGDDKATGA